MVAKSAAAKLSEDKFFNGYRIEELIFTGKKNKIRNDLHVDLFINDTSSHQGEEKLIITTIERSNGIRFLESIYKLSGNKQSGLKGLNKKKIYIICLLVPEVLQNESIPDMDNTKMGFWKVDYLFPLMHKCFNKEATALYKEICSQRNDKLWPIDDDAFYDKIKNLSTDCGEFRKSIELAKSDNDTQGTEYLEKERMQVIKPFDNDIPLIREVLYVAVYFDGLTPREFDVVVSVLIKNSEEKIPYKKTSALFHDSKIKLVSGDIYKAKKKNKKKNKRKKYYGVGLEEKRIDKYWRSRQDTTRRLAHLVTKKDKDNITQIVSLEYPYLKNKLKIYLETNFPEFLSKQLEKIYESMLLYNSSERISDSVSRIMMQAAEADHYYGDEWLTRKVNELKNKTDNDDELTYLIGRISTQIGEMIKRSSLEQTVENLISRMIVSGLSNIVLEICLNLRQVEEFPSLEWINKVLDNRNYYDPERAVAIISWMLIRSKYTLAEILSKFWKCLPENNTHYDHYTKKQKIIFNAVRGVFIQETINIRLDDYNKKKISHEIFLALDSSSNNDIKYIVKYILHPGFINFLSCQQLNVDIEKMIYYWKGKWLIEFIPFKTKVKLRIIGGLFDSKVLPNLEGTAEQLLSAMIKNDSDAFENITKKAGSDICNSLGGDISDYPKAIIAQWFCLLNSILLVRMLIMDLY